MSFVLPVSVRLKTMRQRAGKTIRQVAEELGLGDSHSTYASYEAAAYKKKYIPMEWAERLVPVFVGKGTPPILKGEVLSLAAGAQVELGDAEAPHAALEDPKGEAGPGNGLEYLGRAYAPLPVYDVMVSAGPGSFNRERSIPEGWSLISLDQIRMVTRANADDLAIIRVSGDSMSPTLQNGDQILIDRSIHRIGRDGMYVIATGEEVIVKRISRDWATKSLTISSDNPLYPTSHGVQEEDIVVLGRVVWISRNVGG